MRYVNFLVGSQDEYDAYVSHNRDTLYFIEDTHRIYLGDNLFASGLIENLDQKETLRISGGGAPAVEN